MRSLSLLCLVVCTLASTVLGGGEAPTQGAPTKGVFEWTSLDPLPHEEIGFAGSFVGVHRGGLLVAGGANFPDGAPWLGGAKVWHDRLFVARRDADGACRWLSGRAFKLPRPLAYGVSVSLAEGVVCVGGCDGERCYADVFLLAWDPVAGGVEVTPLPPLPRPLAFMGGAAIGRRVFVAGGQESVDPASAGCFFFSLDLSQRGEEGFCWRSLDAWPGPERILPVCASQSDGRIDRFYLFSGRRLSASGKTEFLTDGWTYSPESDTWTPLSPVAPGGEPRCIMAGTAVASGANHIVVFGGADGRLFGRIESLNGEIDGAPSAAKEALRARLNELLRNHPGFGRDLLAYHTVTDRWHRLGEMPFAGPVTTTAVRWGDAIVLPSGEVRPGVRTPAVWQARSAPVGSFGMLNYTILAIYMAALLAMGVYFSRREKSTDDFFKAGRRVPWWAAGLSIFGTQLSAITFMAIPAKTFATDWRYLTMNMTIVLVAPLVIVLFLPFYRGLNVTTAYEYLEHRFNLAARLIGSFMFILFQVGRIGIVLFLPSIALSVVTGIDVTVCILVMGVLSIAYTVLGGIEAVIWTDVLQVVVLLAGALISLVVVLFFTEGGLSGLIDMAAAADKFHTFDFTFDFASATFWVVLLGGISANLISYGSDQAVIQRYLTTDSERSAARGIWTNGILCVPASLLFFFMGTALFVFYKSHPAAANCTLENGDALFPWFIVSQLPQGVAGLVIAAVFAASMSSLDSSMNSVAAAVTTDFYRRFKGNADDRTCLALARWVTLIVGAAGTALALMMAGWGIKSLWDQINTFIGLFTGGLGGLFLLGVFTRRAHGRGAVVGLVASGVVQFVVARYSTVSFLMYTFTGLVSCLIIGYVSSLLLPDKNASSRGLTLWNYRGRNNLG